MSLACLSLAVRSGGSVSLLRRQIPNALSLLRLVLTPWLWLLIMHQQFKEAMGLMLLALISDGLDGYLARRWHVESVQGAWLDALADKLMLWSLLILLSVRQFIPWWYSGVLLGRDGMLIMAGWSSRWFCGRRLPMRPNRVGKTAIAAQMLSVLLVLGCVAEGQTLSPSLSGLMVLVVVLSLASLLSYGLSWLRVLKGVEPW